MSVTLLTSTLFLHLMKFTCIIFHLFVLVVQVYFHESIFVPIVFIPLEELCTVWLSTPMLFPCFSFNLTKQCILMYVFEYPRPTFEMLIPNQLFLLKTSIV